MEDESGDSDFENIPPNPRKRRTKLGQSSSEGKRAKTQRVLSFANFRDSANLRDPDEHMIALCDHPSLHAGMSVEQARENLARNDIARRIKGENRTLSYMQNLPQKESNWEKDLNEFVDDSFYGGFALKQHNAIMSDRKLDLNDPSYRKAMSYFYGVYGFNSEEIDQLYQNVLGRTNSKMMWRYVRKGYAANEDSDDETECYTERPTVSLQRPRHPEDPQSRMAQVSTVAQHVVLIKHGLHPGQGGCQASHYCHRYDCCRHLVWEPRVFNESYRRRCAARRICSCNLIPACDFTLHPPMIKKGGKKRLS